MMPVVALFPLTDVRQGGKKEVKKRNTLSKNANVAFTIMNRKVCRLFNKSEIGFFFGL